MARGHSIMHFFFFFFFFFFLLLLLLLLLLFGVFHISVSWWSFTGDWVTASLLKSPLTLLSILAVFNNAVVWMVSTRQPTSKFSSTFMLHSFFVCFFFQFYSKVEVIISLFTFFQFYSVVSRDSKVDNFTDYYLLIRVLHITVSWWFFHWSWVTASLFKSPGLVLRFWLFSAMLSFE